MNFNEYLKMLQNSTLVSAILLLAFTRLCGNMLVKTTLIQGI